VSQAKRIKITPAQKAAAIDVEIEIIQPNPNMPKNIDPPRVEFESLRSIEAFCAEAAMKFMNERICAAFGISPEMLRGR